MTCRIFWSTFTLIEHTLFDGLEQTGFAAGRTLIISMTGWNDAGDAASTAVLSLVRQLKLSRTVAEFDDDEFYDYAATRPRIVRNDDGERALAWPGTTIVAAEQPQTDAAARVLPNASRLYALIGAEPSMRWRKYAREIVDVCVRESISRILVVGALLADTPHTRDIPVIMTSETAEFQDEFGIDASQYEGPTGVMSAILEQAHRQNIRSMSMWAQVPHYASAPDAASPKAILAVMNSMQEVLRVSLDTESFAEAGEHWEAQISNAIAMDDDLMQYVKFLEQARDTVDSDAASGDAIAAEFERFLADESPSDDSEDR